MIYAAVQAEEGVGIGGGTGVPLHKRTLKKQKGRDQNEGIDKYTASSANATTVL